jgi:CRISPR/Cas system-associated endoribonuclease Cas2
MTDINKELRAELDKIFAYGIDWTEYKDKSENDHQVSTFAGKIKEELKDELVAKIKALVVESIGKDEVFIDIAEVDHTGKVTKRHFGESYTPYMLARNQLRGEIRSIFE